MGATDDIDTDDDHNSRSAARAADENFCASCGEVIKREAEMYPHCGVRQQSTGDKSPGVAAALSVVGWIIPLAGGAGQLYNGDTGKGVAISIIQCINIALAFFLIGLVTYPIVAIYATYDAYTAAQ